MCKWVGKLLANATVSRLMQFKYCTQSHQLMRGMILSLVDSAVFLDKLNIASVKSRVDLELQHDLSQKIYIN